MEMNREIIAGLTALALAGAPAYADVDGKAYDRSVNQAVVCIKNKLVYEYPIRSRTDEGRLLSPTGEEGGFGSGMIYATEEVNGRTEYLILTNNHVPGAEKVNSKNGLLATRELSLVDNAMDENEQDDIRLELIAVNPDQDMAILRTIGAPELPVADIRFGLPKDIDWMNDGIMTTGFPEAETKVRISGGQITSTEMIDEEVLPVIGTVYTARLPVDPGQSGSPAVIQRMERPGRFKREKPVHYVIGLIYGGSRSDNFRLITPMDERGLEFIASRKDIPSQRPALDDAVSAQEIDTLLDRPQRTPYTISDEFLNIILKDDEGYFIRQIGMEKGSVIDGQFLDIRFTLDDGKVHVTRFESFREGSVKTREPEDSMYLDGVFTAVTNHFLAQQRLRELTGASNRSTMENKQRVYYNNLLKQQQTTIMPDLWDIYSGFSREKFISKEFR